MPLTRDFKETVMARVKSDPTFRGELIVEATNAFLMDDMKMPIREIQDRLKHSSLDMTNHYIGKMRGDKNIYWEKARVMYEMPENPMAKTKK